MGRSNLFGLAAYALLVLALPFVLPDFYFKLIPIGIFALVTTGLSLLLGYAGQISLGHAAFYAIGAYSSGILTAQYAWWPWPAMAVGALLSAILALLVGVPALRLHGHYLAMATLAFGQIVHVVLDAWQEVTGGPSGISEIPPLVVFGVELMPLTNDLGLYYFVWAVAFAGFVAALNVVHSRIGRALRAIHGGEQAATLLGVDTSGYKIRIFVVSAVYASLGGSLYAHYMQYLNPPPFGLLTSILLVLMVIVGGMRSLWGALVGAVLMGLLPEFLSQLENFWIVIYGLVLMLVMIFVPQGIVLGLRDLALRMWPRAQSREGEAGR